MEKYEIWMIVMFLACIPLAISEIKLFQWRMKVSSHRLKRRKEEDIIYTNKTVIILVIAVGFLLLPAIIMYALLIVLAGNQVLIKDPNLYVYGGTALLLFTAAIFRYSKRKIVLRQKGFEINSFLFRNSYEYKDVDFYLTEIGAIKCTIKFKDGRKAIVLQEGLLDLNNGLYASMKEKIQKLINALYKDKKD